MAITPDDAELEELFKDLAKNISKPGATNVVLTDTVSSCFRITSLSSPTKGTARMVNSNTVEWKITELGVSQSEGAAFEFTVEHIGLCTGVVPVNENIDYTDDENNVVVFPSPLIDVDCSSVVCSEQCPQPVEFTISSCEDIIEYDAGEISLSTLGRIVELNVTLRNVCPGKRVALAVMIHEVDLCGDAHKRGIKFYTIPAHTGTACQNVTVSCIRFV